MDTMENHASDSANTANVKVFWKRFLSPAGAGFVGALFAFALMRLCFSGAPGASFSASAPPDSSDSGGSALLSQPGPGIHAPSFSPNSAGNTGHAASLQADFSAAINGAMPAVVLITAQKRIGVISPYSNLFDYGRRKIDFLEVPSGQGSGFFIREDGYILTNYHVVREQDSFWITTHDGKEYPARVAGIDPPTDLALLKIEDAAPFPTLTFADPEKLRIGHWAIAIGAPFSLSRTVTVGIVSNMKRSGVGVNLHESYVQTDASINPGNSGGPLLNIDGEVIGVNDFILSPSGGSIGLSFAISSDIAREISEELILRGRVERPWLGIVMQELSREDRQKLRLDRGGVLVAQIFRGSPAARHLRSGDVILSANGKNISFAYELQGCIFSLAPDSELTLEVLRNGRKITVKTTVRKSPGNWFSGRGRAAPATSISGSL